MSQWGKLDQANNAPLWSGAATGKAAANSANRAALFNNTTQDTLIDNATVGVFGVDTQEMTVQRAVGGAVPTHAGWVLQKKGTGGRAGRTQYETLVAMSSIATDLYDDDGPFANYAAIITQQPVSASGDAGDDDVMTFTVVAESVPAGEDLIYTWQFDNNGIFDAIVDNSTYAGQGTDTLTVNANTAVTGTVLRVVVDVDTAGDSAIQDVSDLVTITVT
jgi:hypothetical protein